MKTKTLIFGLFLFSNFCFGSGILSKDTIPKCNSALLFNSISKEVKSYCMDSTINLVETLGTFNNPGNTDLISLINNIHFNDSLTFISIDNKSWLVYSDPFPTNNTFPSTQIGINLANGEFICSYDNMIYVTQFESGTNRLFKYSIGQDFVLLRDDLSFANYHKTIDENLNFIYMNESGDFLSDAIHIIDTLGTIIYKFDFEEEVNTISSAMFFMHENELYFKGDNGSAPSSLYRIAFDCSNYSAKLVEIYTSYDLDDMYGIKSSAPGKLPINCPPNVNIPSDSTYVVIENPTNTNNLLKDDGNPFSIHPNPVSNHIKIKSLELPAIGYQIYDAFGSLVKTKRGQSEIYDINVQVLTEGSYFLILESSNGEKYINKFVKFRY